MMKSNGKMKRILAVILAVVMAAGLASGCAKKPETEQSTAVESPEAAQSGKDETGATASKNEESSASKDNASEATFTFTMENMPKMDGSTSMVPLGKAVANVLLGQPKDKTDPLIKFNKTTQSFRNLKDGLCDILLVGEPNAAVFDEMENEGFEYELEEVATDALIFVVNEDNPVDNLTTEQIRDIYSGKITNWKEVGGNDAKIIPFQRNEGAGSQALMLKHIMKDTPLMDAPSDLIASEMGELMSVVKSYDNSANAIGYSVYYYANDMKKAEGLKIISVDGVEPCADTIRSREYPHLNGCYCVISASEPEGSPARIMYEWMMSKDGQQLVADEGYVAVSDPQNLSKQLADGTVVATEYKYYEKTKLPDNIYTKIAGAKTDKLYASKNYGTILPYKGSVLYSNSSDGYAYESGHLMGFFTEKGELVTEPVYNDISVLTYWSISDTREYQLPIWVMETSTEGAVLSPESESSYDYDSMEYTFATQDGSFVCEQKYRSIIGSKDRIVCRYARTGAGSVDEDGEIIEEFDVYDLKGNLILSSKDISWRDEFTRDTAWCVEYGDGMYIIAEKYDENYFTDEKGEKKLGPYSSAYVFRNGRAIVGVDQNAELSYTGVIDKKGNWIIPARFSYIESLDNGNFACKKTDGQIEVRDSNGKIVNTVSGAYINTANYGFYTEYKDSDAEEEALTCYDFNGNVIFENDYENYHAVGKSPLVYKQEGAGVKVRNILTGESRYYEGMENVRPFYRAEDTPDIPYYVAENSYYLDDVDEYHSHAIVIDDEFEQKVEANNGNFSVMDDDVTGEWIFSRWANDSDYTYYYDSDFNEIAAYETYGTFADGVFITNDEFACTAYDEDGNAIFRYSLIKSLGD